MENTMEIGKRVASLDERVLVQMRLSAEQKKLEEMVRELLLKGDSNLGTDLRILKQSRILDELIVDEMMLRELEMKYPED